MRNGPGLERTQQLAQTGTEAPDRGSRLCDGVAHFAGAGGNLLAELFQLCIYLHQRQAVLLLGAPKVSLTVCQFTLEVFGQVDGILRRRLRGIEPCLQASAALKLCERLHDCRRGSGESLICEPNEESVCENGSTCECEQNDQPYFHASSILSGQNQIITKCST